MRNDSDTADRSYELERAGERDESREPRRFSDDFRRLFAGARPEKARTESAHIRSLKVGYRPAGGR